MVPNTSFSFFLTVLLELDFALRVVPKFLETIVSTHYSFQIWQM